MVPGPASLTLAALHDQGGNGARHLDGILRRGTGVGCSASLPGCETPLMVDHSIAAHYELGLERDRLFRGGEPRLELTRTLELLDRFLPSAPARLIDVGGGPGAYAAVWARRGYDVHLYDLVVLHVQQARQAAEAQPELSHARGRHQTIGRSADSSHWAIVQRTATRFR